MFRFKRRRSSKGKFSTSRKGRSKRSKTGRESTALAKRSLPPRSRWVSTQRVSTAINWRTSTTADRAFAKLKVSALLTTGSVAVTSVWQFSGNSCFDPFQAHGSIQPTGFDDYAANYSDYSVHASSCYVQPLAGTTATTGNPHIYTLYPITLTQVSTITDAMSMPYSRQCIFNPGNGSSNGSSFGGFFNGQRAWCYQKLKTDKLYRPGAAAYETACGALTSADPSKQWYWEVLIDTADSSSTYTSDFLVTLTYYVEFYGRKGNNQD